MPEEYKPLRIGLRVMQMRLTVIGFNKAIVSFQIAQLARTADGLRLPEIGRSVHVVPELQLFMALGLSFLALVTFIMSGKLDSVGTCTHWPMLAGDLLMYLMMAHTLAGFFGPLDVTVETVTGKASEIHIPQSLSIIIGGAAWFLVTYVGPLVSLVRSRYHLRFRIAIGIAYVAVLLVFCWLTATSVRVESAVSGDEPALVFRVLRELVQPLRW